MKKFKYRLLFYLFLSLLLSSTLTLISYIICTYLFMFDSFSYVLYLLIFIISLFTTFSYFLNYSFLYVDEIISKINEIANGNFDIAIPVSQEDEFSYIAKHINQMAYDLKISKEKEDRANYKEKLQHLALYEEEKKTHDLITNVAHDLKTPITTMMGYLQLLNDHPNYDEKTKNNYLKIVYEKCSRLTRLINDLFHYSAFSSQQVQFNPQKINISELISQIVDEYSTELNNHQITLNMDISNPTLYTMADGELLARVFDNLLTNAIKYNENEKMINIKVEDDNNTITVQISNPSKELSREELDHIFEKFYRTDTSRSSKTGGTGLGLAISKSVIEMHKGEIFATYKNNFLNLIIVLKKEG